MKLFVAGFAAGVVALLALQWYGSHLFVAVY